MFASHRSPQVFGLSAGARFYSEGDNGGGDGGAGEPAPSDTPGSLSEFEPPDGLPVAPSGAPMERVDGEVPPDFGSLGKKPATKEPAEPAKGSDTPPKEEKPAGEPAESKPTPPKQPVKPAAEPKKTLEPVKTPEKQPDPAKAEVKETPEAKAGEKKEGEEPKIPSDEEIEALQPKPGAPTNVIKDFKEMRGKMKEVATVARTVQEENKALRAENETLKQSSGKVPKETEEELEGLRNFNLLFRAEQDPRIKEQFDKPIKQAEDTILTFLREQGMPEPQIEKLKAAAEAAGGDMEAWQLWPAVENALPSAMDRQRLIDARKARISAVEAKQGRLKEITQSKAKFDEEVGKMDEKQRQEFSRAVEQASSAYVDEGKGWIVEEDIPADATAEQKAIIEAKNKEIQARVQQFSGAITSAYHRDPERIAELAFKAVKVDYLKEQLDSVTAERDKGLARIADLEAKISKAKSAGRLGHIETPTQTKVVIDNGGKVGGDGAEAIHSFFRRKN